MGRIDFWLQISILVCYLDTLPEHDRWGPFSSHGLCRMHMGMMIMACRMDETIESGNHRDLSRILEVIPGPRG